MTEIHPDAKLICLNADKEPAVQSTKITATCGHKVWVADSSLPVVLNGNDVWCDKCALVNTEFMAACANGQTRTAPGALAEIERTQGPRVARSIEQELRRIGVHLDG